MSSVEAAWASSTPGMPERTGALGRGRADADDERRDASGEPSASEGGEGPAEEEAVKITASAGASRARNGGVGRRQRHGPVGLDALGPPSPSLQPVGDGRRGQVGAGEQDQVAGRARTGSGKAATRPGARWSAGTRSGSTPAGAGRRPWPGRPPPPGCRQGPGVTQFGHEPAHRVDRREDHPAEIPGPDPGAARRAAPPSAGRSAR